MTNKMEISKLEYSTSIAIEHLQNNLNRVLKNWKLIFVGLSTLVVVVLIVVLTVTFVKKPVGNQAIINYENPGQNTTTSKQQSPNGNKASETNQLILPTPVTVYYPYPMANGSSNEYKPIQLNNTSVEQRDDINVTPMHSNSKGSNADSENNVPSNDTSVEQRENNINITPMNSNSKGFNVDSKNNVPSNEHQAKLDNNSVNVEKDIVATTNTTNNDSTADSEQIFGSNEHKPKLDTIFVNLITANNDTGTLDIKTVNTTNTTGSTTTTTTTTTTTKTSTDGGTRTISITTETSTTTDDSLPNDILVTPDLLFGNKNGNHAFQDSVPENVFEAIYSTTHSPDLLFGNKDGDSVYQDPVAENVFEVIYSTTQSSDVEEQIPFTTDDTIESFLPVRVFPVEEHSERPESDERMFFPKQTHFKKPEPEFISVAEHPDRIIYEEPEVFTRVEDMEESQPEEQGFFHQISTVSRFLMNSISEKLRNFHFNWLWS